MIKSYHKDGMTYVYNTLLSGDVELMEVYSGSDNIPKEKIDVAKIEGRLQQIEDGQVGVTL